MFHRITAPRCAGSRLRGDQACGRANSPRRTRAAVTDALQAAGPHALVTAAASRHVVTVAPSDALGDVLDQLRASPDSVALVVDHGLPVGVLTEDSLVAYAATLAKLS